MIWRERGRIGEGFTYEIDSMSQMPLGDWIDSLVLALVVVSFIAAAAAVVQDEKVNWMWERRWNNNKKRSKEGRRERGETRKEKTKIKRSIVVVVAGEAHWPTHGNGGQDEERERERTMGLIMWPTNWVSTTLLLLLYCVYRIDIHSLTCEALCCTALHRVVPCRAVPRLGRGEATALSTITAAATAAVTAGAGALLDRIAIVFFFFFLSWNEMTRSVSSWRRHRWGEVNYRTAEAKGTALYDNDDDDDDINKPRQQAVLYVDSLLFTAAPNGAHWMRNWDLGLASPTPSCAFWRCNEPQSTITK